MAVLVVWLAGCARLSDDDVACTLVGDFPGVTVTVAGDVSPIRDLVLTTCVDGDCTDHDVAVSQYGTRFGHVQADLPEGPLEVSGSYRTGMRRVTLAPVTVDVTRNYPNGRDCAPGGTGASVTIGPDGLT